jgi:SAM-dependent methyltransferase
LAHDTGYEKCAHLYDLFDTKENIEFFLHYGSEAGEILDIGAGTGRIAFALAEKDVKVFCVEPSPAMHEQFEKKLRTHPELAENIRLIGGNASSFDFKRTFPAAILSGSFDHFMDDHERVSSLRNIAKHLKAGGMLVFDVGLGFMDDSPLKPAGQVDLGDKHYRRFVSRKRLPDGKLDWLLIYEVYQSGKLIERIEEHSQCGTIDRAKLHRLLEETGFEIKKEFGDWDFKEYEEGNLFLIVEAMKI